MQTEFNKQINNIKGKKLLYLDQEEVVDEIIESSHRGHLIEAPTGKGKTLILLEAAKRLKKLYPDKRIVISTSNNALVKDSYDSARRFGYLDGDEEIDMVLGKTNYIDPYRLQRAFEVYGLAEMIDMEEYEVWLDTFGGDERLFYDDFNSMITYTDISNEKHIQSLIVYENRSESMKDFQDCDIAITNHYYLLFKFAVSKMENKDQYIVLIDEVHEIINVAEVILQRSFSPYYLYALLSSLRKELAIKEEEWPGKKALISDLEKGANASLRFARSFAEKHQDLIGESVDNPSDLRHWEKEIELFGTSDKLKSVLARINKTEKKNIATPELLNIFGNIKKEVGEMKEIIDVCKRNAGHEHLHFNINVSLSRGYPRFTSMADELTAMLHFRFWSTLYGFCGLSATLGVDTKTGKNAFFSYRRLGISLEKSLGRTPPTIYPRTFPKENVQVYMPKSDMPKPPSGKEVKNKDIMRKWAEDIYDYFETYYHGENSMILAGSFAEVDALSAVFKEKLAPKLIISASKDKKMNQTLSEFKERGGVLLATRNFGTGVSLNGNALEALYIVKHPYPIFTNSRWTKIKRSDSEQKEHSFWYLINNEMLIFLRQYIGRLQRTPDDCGKIHIVTSQIFKNGKCSNPDLLRRIRYFAGQYGLIVNESTTPIKKKGEIKQSSMNELLEFDF